MFKKLNVYAVYGRTKKGNLILDECGGEDKNGAKKVFLNHYPNTKIEHIDLIGKRIHLPLLGSYRYKTYSDEELLRLREI